MTVKLRRPARGTGRPGYAAGGAVAQVTVAPPAGTSSGVEDRARRALGNAGVERPSAPQVAHVAQAVARDGDRAGHIGETGPAVARALQIGGSNGLVPQPGSDAGLSPNVQAALAVRSPYARGGTVSPGLPASPFRAAALPTIPTPGLASPHGLTAARHRTHFADGGAAIPASVMAALALRPHFDGGGDVSGAEGDFGAFGWSTQPQASGSEGGAIYGGAPQDGSVQSGGVYADPDGAAQMGGGPAIGADSGLPSAGRDPSGLLQNGTDTTALNSFWAGKTNTMPSPQWSNTHAGLAPNGGPLGGGDEASAPVPAAAPVSMPEPSASPAIAAPYNPMADDRVRSSLGLATGGVARADLPASVRDALMARAPRHPLDGRPHFEDGGDAGGGGGSGNSSGGDARSGGGGNSDGGNSSSSSSSSSSGDASGGRGDSSNSSSGSNGDGGPGGNSNSASGAGGGVGGFGGGSGGHDSYGGSSTSSSTSSGGQSDASTGGGYGGSSASSGGNSDASSGAASGSVSGLGASGGYGSATSGPVGSIGGSVGAPAAGGFSSEGAPSTGGFGSFGATPSATSNPAGLSGGTPTASSLSGQTAGQAAAAEARGGGDPGEDGTTSAGAGVSTSGAFGSFGPAPSSPFGSMARAQSDFGGTQASDLGSVPGLSAMGQQLGQTGLGGVPGAMAANPNGFASPGAYGLSTTANGDTPGMDNFNSAGAPQSTMLGEHGFTGLGDPTDAPNTAYSTLAGNLPASVVNAMYAGLPGYEAAQTDLADLSGSFHADYSGTAFGPDGKLSVPGNTLTGTAPAVTAAAAPGLGLGVGPSPTSAPTDTAAPTAGLGLGTPSALTIHGPMTEAAYGGYDAPGAATPFGAISDKQVSDARQNIAKGIGTAADQAIASGYAQQQAVPAATRTAGLAGLGVAPTSTTSGLNADGDPTSVDGTSALTIHGDLSPSAATMTGGLDPSTVNGVPAVHTFAGVSPSYAQTVGKPINKAYQASTLSNDTGVTSMPTFATMGTAPQTPGMGPMTLAGIGAGFSSDQGAPSDGPQTSPQVAAPVAQNPLGLPAGAVFGRLGKIEGGVLNGQVDPKNPTHYGPAQFDQPTFSDTVAAHPELGISPGMPMRQATAEQYAGVTQAHWNDVQAALQKAGIEPTPGNTYLGWNRGITGAINAINAGPDASLAAAGITPAIQRANPSIYGGVSTVGQLQGKLAGMFSGVDASPTSAPGGIPASVQQALQHGPANYSPGAASGMDTTDTKATSVNPGISPPSTWSPGQPTAPTTQTVSTPAPYGVTPGTAATLGNFGMAATPANALAGDTLGYGVASQIMNGVPSDPVESAGVSDAAMAANPSFFSGAKTIGDVQANIAKAAETAGTTTSTVTTPGAPASPDALPGYSYSPGVASGLDSMGLPGASPYGISQPGVYGTPATTTQPGVTTAPPATTGTPATPDTSTPSHLSVPTGITNTVAGLGLGALGPIGFGLAGLNTVSGWLGGPTIGSALNGILAGSGGGTASPIGGQGDNSTSPGMNSTTPGSGYGSGWSGDPSGGVPSAGSTSSGASPLDPHADAMAAYDAAMAGMGRSTSGTSAGTIPSPPSAGSYDGSARPLVIHRGGHPGVTPTPLYNPMQDPSVLRALGMD